MANEIRKEPPSEREKGDRDGDHRVGEIGDPRCRTGLARRGQDQVDVPFQAHALNRDEPQNAVWCGQHRVLQADWSEADTDACADHLEE